MSTCQTEDLGALLEQVRCGDEMALTQLLQRYESQLRLAARVLLSQRLRTQLDSLDLVQSVHRVLLPGLRDGKYDVSSLDKLLALARTVVRHKCIRHWRRIECQHTTGGQEGRQRRTTAGPACSHRRSEPDCRGGRSQTADSGRIERPGPAIDRASCAGLRHRGYCGAASSRPARPARRLGRLRNRLRRQSFCEWL